MFRATVLKVTFHSGAVVVDAVKRLVTDVAMDGVIDGVVAIEATRSSHAPPPFVNCTDNDGWKVSVTPNELDTTGETGHRSTRISRDGWTESEQVEGMVYEVPSLVALTTVKVMRALRVAGMVGRVKVNEPGSSSASVLARGGVNKKQQHG